MLDELPPDMQGIAKSPATNNYFSTNPECQN